MGQRPTRANITMIPLDEEGSFIQPILTLVPNSDSINEFEIISEESVKAEKDKEYDVYVKFSNLLGVYNKPTHFYLCCKYMHI